MSTECCESGAPVVFNYVPHGQCYTVFSGTTSETPNPLTIYLTGTGSKGIVIVPDIWGLSYGQVFYVADSLATQGFSVAVVDIYRFNTWPYGTPPNSEVADFINKLDPAGIQSDIDTAAETLKTKNSVTSVGVLGFCFGASPAFTAGQNELKYNAVAGAHAYFPNGGTGVGAALKVPCALIAANGDPLSVIQEEISDLPISAKSVFQSFDDMTHGFMAARGDLDDVTVLQRVSESVTIFATFFNNTL